MPTHPETGFGYLRATLDGANAVPVESFVEKPDAETAKKYVADGKHFWNSGMFMFKASTYLETLKQLAPAMYEACQKSMKNQSLDGLFVQARE